MSFIKELYWVAASYKDLLDFPDDVKSEVGFGLYRAQIGEKHDSAKSLRGFGGTGVLEIVEDHRGDAYRCVYTVKFANAVYVLHAFKKKSKSGISTPKSDIDLVKKQLKLAEDDYKKRRNE